MNQHEYIPYFPKRITNAISWLMLFMTVVLLSGFLLVQKPETVMGECVIFSGMEPHHLLARASGTIWYLHNDGDTIKKGDDIAYIQHVGDYNRIKWLLECLTDSNSLDNIEKITNIPITDLGEVSSAYLNLFRSKKIFENLKESNLYANEIMQKSVSIQSIEEGLRHQHASLKEHTGILSHYEHECKRDSLLYASNSITVDNYNQARLRLIQQKENVARIKSEIEHHEYEIRLLRNEIDGIDTQHREDIEKAKNEILICHEALIDAVNLWQSKYVIKSEIDGLVENPYHIDNMQNINEGIEIARILPQNSPITGRINFSNVNAAKIKDGNDVKIILDDYEKSTYGFLTGKISNLSQSTLVSSDSQVIYTANLNIDFDNQPNFKGDFRLMHGMRGKASIIVKQQPLILSILNWVREACSK